MGEQRLQETGWTVECQSPLEIRHEDGSFASGQAAQIVIDSLESEAAEELRRRTLIRLDAVASLARNVGDSYSRQLWEQAHQEIRTALGHN